MDFGNPHERRRDRGLFSSRPAMELSISVIRRAEGDRQTIPLGSSVLLTIARRKARFDAQNWRTTESDGKL
jgi:hypothetical protein